MATTSGDVTPEVIPPLFIPEQEAWITNLVEMWARAKGRGVLVPADDAETSTTAIATTPTSTTTLLSVSSSAGVTWTGARGLPTFLPIFSTGSSVSMWPFLPIVPPISLAASLASPPEESVSASLPPKLVLKNLRFRVHRIMIWHTWCQRRGE